MPTLSIGIIHNRGRKTLAATIRALRRTENLGDAELLVVDVRGRRKTRKWVKRQPGIRYVRPGPDHANCALDLLFAAASGEVVLVLEGPVRLKRGALAALRGYFDAHPDACELLHGPLMDGKRLVATHSNPFWQRSSWGKRARDPRGLVANGEAFAIPMQEAGVFSCRRAAWPGLPPGWRGYGAEAGYLEECFRRRGAQVLCLPGLRWERAARPDAIRPCSPEALETLRNHFAGAADLGLDIAYIAQRYRDHLEPGEASHLRVEVLRERERDDAAGAPLVSCLLYAGRLDSPRQTLLDEAVESFLRQDYARKELILLNDWPGQFLVCDVPGVRVVNTSSRCPSLGDCYNAAAAFAQGELLAPWDGASINLPWRLSMSIVHLGNLSVYRPDGCWYMLDGELDDRAAQPDGGQVALLTREAFRSVGGYPSITLGLHREMDTALDAWLLASGRPRPHQTLPQDAWFTIMRRTQDDVQYAGDPFLDPWQADGQLPHKSGRVLLQPHWEDDYPTFCQKHMASERIEHPPAPLVVAYVLRRRRGGEQNWFPRQDQLPDQTTAHHLERVAALVAAVVAAGGTHLVIPRPESSWVSLHPHVAEYLTARHVLIEASPEAGFIFALNDEEFAQPGAPAEASGG